MDADAIVIGAGLAGLNAARELTRRGLRTVVLEAGDDIGGRVRTELIDGFRVDRGFQVLNPAYPALGEAVDVDRLALAPFGRGVVVRRGPDLRVLTDPSRAPWRAAGLLRLVSRDPRGAAGLAAWLAPALRGGEPQARTSDTTVSASLDAVGARGPLREQVLEPFLSGVLADDTGSSSAVFARRLVRWFALRTPGLPAQGMAALPAMLRKQSDAELRLGVRVTGLDREAGGWRVRADGASFTARGVVVATDPPTAGSLCRLAVAPMRGLATWWFAPDEPPTDSTHLHVDGRREGPVVNTVVISNVQPSYAPAGRCLVQASTLLAGEAPGENEVRRHVGSIYGCSADRWPVVAVHHLPHALATIEPGRAFVRAYSEAGLTVAGDAADASIQGALDSGSAAGRRLARDLAASPERTSSPESGDGQVCGATRLRRRVGP